MPGRKTNHAAFTLNRFAMEQLPRRTTRQRHIRQQRGIIVREDEGLGVLRIGRITSPLVARTQITLRIVSRPILRAVILALPLPWALCSMRGNKNPLTAERIITAVWVKIRIKIHGAISSTGFERLRTASWFKSAMAHRNASFKLPRRTERWRIQEENRRACNQKLRQVKGMMFAKPGD